MAGDLGEDDSVLEQLDELVDVVLASDLAPPGPEDPWEHRQPILDSWTAVLLAIAAVATAWASFQASQWSGAQSDDQSQSAISRAAAGRAATYSTKFVLLAVMLALVLFFASVATKFSGPKVQVMLTLPALLLLLVSLVRMAVLPQFVSGRPDAPPRDATVTITPAS